MLQISRSIIENPKDETQVMFIHSDKSLEEFVFRSEVDDMADYWNFKRHYIITKPREQEHLQLMKRSYFTFGERINFELLQRICPSFVERSAAFVCGTKVFNEQISEYLLKLGYSKDSIKCFY